MLKPIDAAEPTPRHQQAYDQILTAIRGGSWKAGEKIPAELELASQLGVAKLTVHRAVQALASEGWVVRGVGKGTFVAPQPPLLRRVVLAFGSSPSNLFTSDYYGKLYQGIVEALEVGSEFVLASRPVHEGSVPSADGTLVIAPRKEALPALESLQREGRPLVVLGAHWATSPFASVDSDNAQGGQLALRHFDQQGHRSAVLVFAEPETANTRDRVDGFLGAAKRRGIEVRLLEAQAFWRLTPTEKGQLLAWVQAGATAVFAAGYYLALDSLNALREAGYRTPDDVSVVGFDDPASAGLVYPALTTLRQPLYEMGRRAAQRLQALAAGSLDCTAELLPVELIVRGSTHPPKGSSS